MTEPSRKMTLDEIKEYATQKIPYEVGNGQACIQARTSLMKKLMRKNKIPINPEKQLVINDF
jgi:hypothetical protein